VDLVDKQNVARLQAGEQRREVASTLDYRPRCRAKPDPEFPRDDLRQCGLAEPGRTRKQHMIEGFIAALRSTDKDREVVAQLLLTDKFAEVLRADRGIWRVLLAWPRRDETVRRIAQVATSAAALPSADCASSCSPARIRAST